MTAKKPGFEPLTLEDNPDLTLLRNRFVTMSAHELAYRSELHPYEAEDGRTLCEHDVEGQWADGGACRMCRATINCAREEIARRAKTGDKDCRWLHLFQLLEGIKARSGMSGPSVLDIAAGVRAARRGY